MALTADETPGGWDIEFQTPAPFQEDNELGFTAAIKSMADMGRVLDARKQRKKVPLKTIEDAGHGTIVQGYDDIYTVPDTRGMMASPQLTGGFRLDQIATMMESLGHATQKTEPRTGKVYEAEDTIHSVLMERDQFPIQAGGARAKTGLTSVFNALHAHDNTITNANVAPLEGVMSLAISYMVKGSLPDAGNQGPILNQYQGKQKYTVAKGLGLSKKEVDGYVGHPQAMMLAKSISPLQARTDFSGMFEKVPDNVKAAVRALGANWWSTQVLAAATMADGKMYQYGFFTDDADFVDYPLTRAEWLQGMIAGQDLLTYAVPQADPNRPNERVDPNRPERQQLYKSLGLLKGKTDVVGSDNVAGAIIELRRMGSDVPLRNWEPMAKSIFKWVAMINDPNAARVILGGTTHVAEEESEQDLVGANA
jgi:hypothetical protein